MVKITVETPESNIRVRGDDKHIDKLWSFANARHEEAKGKGTVRQSWRYRGGLFQRLSTGKEF